MTTLSTLLGKRPHDPQGLRKEVLEKIFAVDMQKRAVSQFDDYFDYYEHELGMLRFGQSAQSTKAPILSATHRDLICTIRELRNGVDYTKSQLRTSLLKHCSQLNEPALDSLLELATRLWLLVNVRNPLAKMQTLHTPTVIWSEFQTLQDFLDEAFRHSRWKVEVKDSRLHPSFTVAFMVDVCRLKIEWTHCLADHLRLDRRSKVLRVFPHKAILEAHLGMAQQARPLNQGVSDNPLPEKLLIETIWTLNILFPQWDRATNELLRHHGQRFQQHGPYDEPPTLHLVEFDYHRDRLLELYDVVFLSPPVSWAQLWRDRRNPQQFWTFWIALIILILTLMSTITGIIQAWASARPSNH